MEVSLAQSNGVMERTECLLTEFWGLAIKPVMHNLLHFSIQMKAASCGATFTP